jgi:hypothetical protein
MKSLADIRNNSVVDISMVLGISNYHIVPNLLYVPYLSAFNIFICKGMIWTKDPTSYDWWEVEITFRYGACRLFDTNVCSCCKKACKKFSNAHCSQCGFGYLIY